MTTISQTSDLCPTRVLKQCWVSRSQNLTNVSSELLTKIFWLSRKQHLVMGPLCPLNRKRPASETVSQTMMFVSFAPETSLMPSSSNERHVTALLCPLKVTKHSPLLRSNSLTTPSSYPTAICLLLGLVFNTVTQCFSPNNVLIYKKRGH